MNWKITLRFILTITIINMLVIFIAFSLVNYYFFGSPLPLGKNVDHKETSAEIMGAEKFAWDFSKHILFQNDKPSISNEGIEKLKENSSWIQILDNEGNEVYSHSKPYNAPRHYSPVEIVHAYKYNGVIGDSSIFIGMIKSGDLKYSYVLGRPYDLVARYIIYLNFSNFTNPKEFIFLILGGMLIIIIGLSYLFGKRLTKPLFQVINGIQTLAYGDYSVSYPEKGIYRDMYSNFNALSNTLDKNNIEKIRLDKIREDWIENFCHDIKTPLSSVKGYGEILLDSSYSISNNEGHNYLKIMVEKTDYIEDLLNDLKFTYKLKNNLTPLNKATVNLKEFLTEIIIGILNHPLYENREINFSYDEEPILIDLDINLFTRAIQNLIYNSLVHNDKKTVVSVLLYQHDNIHIQIEDNGNGMSEESLQSLFERYYRGKGTNEGDQGSGLGMVIAKEIVETHGGNIQVKSQLGEGTKINVTI